MDWSPVNPNIVLVGGNGVNGYFGILTISEETSTATNFNTDLTTSVKFVNNGGIVFQGLTNSNLIYYDFANNTIANATVIPSVANATSLTLSSNGLILAAQAGLNVYAWNIQVQSLST